MHNQTGNETDILGGRFAAMFFDRSLYALPHPINVLTGYDPFQNTETIFSNLGDLVFEVHWKGISHRLTETSIFIRFGFILGRARRSFPG